MIFNTFLNLPGDAATGRPFGRQQTRGAGAPEVEGVASYSKSR